MLRAVASIGGPETCGAGTQRDALPCTAAGELSVLGLESKTYGLKGRCSEIINPRMTTTYVRATRQAARTSGQSRALYRSVPVATAGAPYRR